MGVVVCALAAPTQSAVAAPDEATSRVVSLALDAPAEAPALASGHAGHDDAAGHQQAATSSQWFTAPDVPAEDGVLVGADWGGEDAVVAVRARQPSGWTDWRQLHLGGHEASGAEARAANPDTSDPVWFGASSAVQVRADRRLQVDLHVVEVDLAAARRAATSDQAATSGTHATLASGPSIHIRSRSAWGADESLRSGSPRYADKLKFGVVHHEGATPRWTQQEIANGCQESPAAIRAIYRYHTQSHGWSDIGYNFVVDPCGKTWEGRYGGRRAPVIGAHTGGFNTGAFGVLALGSFQDSDDDPITSEMVIGLEKLFAWKFSLAGIDADSTVRVTGGGSSSRYDPGTTITVPRVSAHRITNHTSCPGGFLFDRLFDGDGPSARPTGWFVDDIVDMTHPPVVDVDRLAGDNRVETAVAVSRRAFSGANVAVLATTRSYADGLVAGPLAGVHGGPVLLTGRASLPGDVARELQRLGTQRVILVGGGRAISSNVAQQLRNRGYDVDRLGGENRFHTAARVADHVRDVTGTRASLIALGRHDDPGSAFPDALSAGGYGAVTRAPVLLVAPRALPATTEAALSGTNRVVIFGGTAAVSSHVEAEIDRATGDVNKTRFAGRNRYETSAMSMSSLQQRGVVDGTSTMLVSGGNWPDALGAAAAARERGQPMLLVRPIRGYSGSSTHDALRRWDTQAADIVGGWQAVSFTIESAVRLDG